jgi:hypothetical protein
MIEFDAFISYSTKDKAVADAACAALEGAGVRCWVAPRDVLPGAEWGGSIVKAIDHCHVMVLIFSSHANASKQVVREVQRAISRGVPLVPLRIENTVPTDTLAYFMDSVHWLDALSPPLENHLRRLTDAVRAFLHIDLQDSANTVSDQKTANVPIDEHLSSVTPAGAALSIAEAPAPGLGATSSSQKLRSRLARSLLGCIGVLSVALLIWKFWPTNVVVDTKDQTVFYDDFHTQKVGWDLGQDNRARYEDDQLVLAPSPGSHVSVQNKSALFKEGTICSHIKTSIESDSSALAGVAFFGVDSANYWLAVLSANGEYAVYKRFNGKSFEIVPRTKSEAIKQGENATNELKVSMIGGIARYYINGTKVDEFRITLPSKEGGSIGLFAQSGRGTTDEWRFRDIAMIGNTAATCPAPPPESEPKTTCPPLGAADFEDTFKAHDPGWRIQESERVFYSEGQLVIKPLEGRAFSQWHSSLVYKNATICALFKGPRTSSLQETSAGLLFWQDNVDARPEGYYLATISSSGTYEVRRRIQSIWATVVPRTTSDNVKKGSEAINEIKIEHTSHDTGRATLYINGVRVREFRGQPLKEGSRVGIYAESGKEVQSEWRFLNLTVVQSQ